MTMRSRDEPSFDDETPPPPEFDRDAQYAFASPGLAAEERNAILLEARDLASQGLAREAVANWICCKVALTVGGRSGFDAVDAHGNVIDPPHVVAAIGQRNRDAGSRRQHKRNAAIAEWRARCESLVGAGGDRKDIAERCCTAAFATTKRALGQKLCVIELAFEGLPPIFGRKTDRAPSRRSLRKRLIGPLVRSEIVD
jgi:hypothetical protein